MDVLDAEQELLDAKVSLVRAQRDELSAAFQVQEAVGRLTAAELGLAVKVYDMNDHYNEVRDSWFGDPVVVTSTTPMGRVRTQIDGSGYSSLANCLDA